MGYYWLVLCALVAHIHGVAMWDDKSMNISSSGHYDYGDALAKAILFFKGQRSGKLPSIKE